MNAKAASELAPPILYVEDEECDRLFMGAAFRKAGMAEAFRTVSDGREAMNYLEGSGAYADRGQHPAHHRRQGTAITVTTGCKWVKANCLPGRYKSAITFPLRPKICYCI